MNHALKILAFSDIQRWSGYERLVELHKPDVIALAGDLTSDGGAAFWDDALELIAEFRRERLRLFRRIGKLRSKCVVCEESTGVGSPYQKCKTDSHLSWRFVEHVEQLEDHYRSTQAFKVAHKKTHTDKFYRFLEYAGKRARVLVVKGDHDSDFEGDYNAERIDQIPGCSEISGKTHFVDGHAFLGVSFDVIAYRSSSSSLLNRFPSRGGIVIAHARQGNVRLLADLKPRLIIRGHFGLGKYFLDGVPAVFTAGTHALIEIRNTGLPLIQQPATITEEFIVREGPRRIRKSTKVRVDTSSFVRDYGWLKDYSRCPKGS